MKSVHKRRLKTKRADEGAGGGNGGIGASKTPKESTVAFPWKWVGVGAIVLILILAVVVIKPSFSSNPNSNNNNSPECIEGKTIVASFDFTLHILKTDNSSGLHDYTHPISYGIGKQTLNGQPCTRRMYTSDLGPPYEYNASTQAAIVHVRSPMTNNSLGDFFRIWDQVLNYSQGFVVAYSSTTWNIVMKVNGQTYSGIWEQLALQPGMKIEFYVTKIA